MEYSKNNPFVIRFNNSREIDIEKKSCAPRSLPLLTSPTPLKLLFPIGKTINSKKYEDLLHLLQYVPQQYHPFYRALKHIADEEDYGLASDSSNE